MRPAWWCSLALLAGGCQKIFGLQHFDYSHYKYAKTITITSPTDVPVDSFPVSVTLASDPDLAAHAAADGSDLAFYDGTMLLPTELVHYDHGTLDAWIELPTLAPGTTTIQLLYGGPIAMRETPWSANAIGVWHASEPGDVMSDHSGHGHDVSILANTTAPAIVPGLAGDARQFNGVTDRMCGADGDQSMVFGSSSFSFEAWVDVDKSITGQDRPFSYGGSGSGDTGYDFELGAGFWTPNVADGTTLLNMMTLAESEALHKWTQLVAVVDREAAQLQLYAFGTLHGTTPIPAAFGAVSTQRPICFSGAIAPFSGVIDEIRVWSGALDAAWVRASYANLAERPTFLSVGPELPNSTKSGP